MAAAIHTTVRLKADLVARIDGLSKRKNLTKTEVINRLLRTALAKTPVTRLEIVNPK
jgi:hypothetical protein